MGKKYIVKLDDNKLAYTAIIIDGVPYIKPLQLLPYTEPDTSEAYQRGYETAKHECEDCLINVGVEEIRKEAYEQGLNDANYAIADDSYQNGLSDAWECARKVTYVSKYGGYGDCLDKVFNRHDGTEWDVFDYSASEALKEVRAYEQAQKEIRAKEICVADVVQNKKDPYIKVFVTTVNDGKFSGVALTTVAGHCNRGNMFSYQDAERWEKVSGDWWRCLNEDNSE